MNLNQLKSLRTSLDDLYLDDLKDLCRANNIVHSNKKKLELIFELKKLVLKCKQKLPKNEDNNLLNYLKVKDEYMKYTKEGLKDILVNYRQPYSNLSKDEMIERIIDFDNKLNLLKK
jgi:hypothetical protein